MPVQRIPRYKLLLEDFLKNTDKAHSDYANLQAALSKVNEVAAFINESVRKSDNAKKMMGMSSKGANFDVSRWSCSWLCRVLIEIIFRRI